MWEALNGGLTARETTRLRGRLQAAAKAAPSPQHADLANALLNFVQTEADSDPPAERKAKASARPVRRFIARVFSQHGLRIVLIVGLAGIGLLTLKNPVTVLLGPQLPGLADFLSRLHVGRHVEAQVSPLWASVRLGLEVGVGALLLTASGLLIAGEKKRGTAVGYVGLLLSLTTVDVLLFYFEQFSTIITTALQFLLLTGVIVYRRHAARQAEARAQKTPPSLPRAAGTG